MYTQTANISRPRTLRGPSSLLLHRASAQGLSQGVVLVATALVFAMQFYKPSGTGAEGSPATGPIPVLIAMALPILYGNFVA